MDRNETAEDRLPAPGSLAVVSNNLPSQPYDLETMEADNFADVNDIVSHVIADLSVFLSEEDMERMRDWGTRNVHAYRYARVGDTYQRNSTVESLNRAAALFRKSIDEDSKFHYGYISLSAVFHDLAMMSPDTPYRERVRQNLQELYREVFLELPNSETARTIERQYRFQSISSAFDAEAFWRSEILADPTNVEALRRYADLLVGAGLVSESERYLRKARSLAPVEELDWLEMAYATHALARGDQAEGIRLMKLNIDRFPDFTLSLFGLVRTQSALGNFQEAETYLTQLKSSDAVWGYSAQLALQAFRGDLPQGSEALQSAFDHPMANNVTRGSISFILGDIPAGVSYWQRIEPGFLRLFWQHNTGQEWMWAEGVTEDPRYQALLNELGIGTRWRTYMRTEAESLNASIDLDIGTSL
jgi:tetratricopeptide (TPR) repeat protein